MRPPHPPGTGKPWPVPSDLLHRFPGEAWNGLMLDCMVEPPFCDPHLGNCGRPLIAPVFFTTFTLVGMFVLLNLFIAVILDNFGEVQQLERSVSAWLLPALHPLSRPSFQKASADWRRGGSRWATSEALIPKSPKHLTCRLFRRAGSAPAAAVWASSSGLLPPPGRALPAIRVPRAFPDV